MSGALAVRNFRLLFGARAISFFGTNVVPVALAFAVLDLAKESLGGSSAWAVILTGEAVGAMLGGIVALRWRPAQPLVTICLLFLGAAVQPALLALGAPTALIAWTAGMTGFAFAFGTVVFETIVQQRVRPEHLSRVSAYNWFTAMCCLPLGYALAGQAATLLGMDAVLWFGAGWIVVTTLALVTLPEIRRLRWRDELCAAPAAA